MSVRAYILASITTHGNAEQRRILTRLRGTKSVQSADLVTGPHDIVIVVEAETIDELTRLLTEEIQSVEGIAQTLTCIVLNIGQEQE